MEIHETTEHTYHVFQADEWAALYIDGKLDTVGDVYLADERLAEIFGVIVEQSNDFLRGGYSRSDVAMTLDQLNAYRDKRERDQADADELRRQATELLQRAAELDGQR